MKTPTHFVPSTYLLNYMLASADAKFEAAREQARLREEAREAERHERFMNATAKARYYFGLQHGVGRP